MSDDVAREAMNRRAQLLGDVLTAAQARFRESDPPVVSWHASGPYRPPLGRGEWRVWFLFADEAAVARARENGLLPALERAVAEAREAAVAGDTDPGEIACFLDTVARHSCCVPQPADTGPPAA